MLSTLAPDTHCVKVKELNLTALAIEKQPMWLISILSFLFSHSVREKNWPLAPMVAELK